MLLPSALPHAEKVDPFGGEFFPSAAAVSGSAATFAVAGSPLKATSRNRLKGRLFRNRLCRLRRIRRQIRKIPENPSENQGRKSGRAVFFEIGAALFAHGMEIEIARKQIVGIPRKRSKHPEETAVSSGCLSVHGTRRGE